jgi:hypothetical protein
MPAASGRLPEAALEVLGFAGSLDSAMRIRFANSHAPLGMTMVVAAVTYPSISSGKINKHA